MRLIARDGDAIQYGGEPLSFAQIEEMEATGQVVFNDTPQSGGDGASEETR